MNDQAEGRKGYSGMAYRRVGRSGITLPAVSLGLWQNFGDDSPTDLQRNIIRAAFDQGVTHTLIWPTTMGRPLESTETNFGRVLRSAFRHRRDELFISTKAGYRMWDGPYGHGGSRKHMLASLDQSLERLGVDYVDVFYSHRADPEVPLEETMAALHSAVQSGKALYAGISSYSADRSVAAAEILSSMGTPLAVNQCSYSMFNRWIERGLLDELEEQGVGCVAFSPLAQGLLTDKYLHGIPNGSRASRNGSMKRAGITEHTIRRVRALSEIAAGRDQSLAQMALSWSLRDPRISSVLVGASSVGQLNDNLQSLAQPTFSAEELSSIDELAIDAGINLWAASSNV